MAYGPPVRQGLAQLMARRRRPGMPLPRQPIGEAPDGFPEDWGMRGMSPQPGALADAIGMDTDQDDMIARLLAAFQAGGEPELAIPEEAQMRAAKMAPLLQRARNPMVEALRGAVGRPRTPRARVKQVASRKRGLRYFGG